MSFEDFLYVAMAAILKWNFCGHLRIPINKILARFDPVATEQVSAQSKQKFGKRKLIYKMVAMAAILDFLSAHLAILCLLGALMLMIKFQFNRIIEKMSKI